MAEFAGMKQLRADLATTLKRGVPRDWVIFPGPGVLDAVQKPTLMLVRSKVEPFKDAPQSILSNTLQLWLIAPERTNEDSLDDWTQQLLQALDANSIAWTSADRSTWNESGPAYSITLTANSNRKVA